MNFGSSIDKCVEDAFGKLKKPFDGFVYDWKRVTVYSWPQVWPSTSCGFGGIAGRAMTTAQTVVVFGQCEDVAVYHKGRFAYYIESPSEAFAEAFGKGQLPGAAEKRDHLDAQR